MYFSKNDQNNIAIYLNLESDLKKEFYQDKIYPVFYKLAESLINVYDFKSPLATKDELIADCTGFLYEVIYKWDPDRGKKAFSYFNVVAKNWLILNTRKHFKIAIKELSADDEKSMNSTQRREYEESDIVESPEENLENKQSKFELLDLVDDMRVLIRNDQELRCLHAIETLFMCIDELDLLSKRAIKLYLTEISGLDKQQLNKSLASIKKIYNKLSNNPSVFKFL